MTKKKYRFETVVDLPPSLAGKVKDVLEEDSAVAPRMDRDVYGVAASYAKGVFLFSAGLFFIVTISASIAFDLALKYIALLVAIAFLASMSAAGLVYVVVFHNQKKWYQEHVTRRRTYGIVRENESDRREYQRLASNPKTLKAARYLKWTEKKKKAFAARLITADGQWIGGERFIRDKHIKGIIENYTDNYQIIAGDFAAWGWVEKIAVGKGKHLHYIWTRYGKLMIKAWRLDPPAPSRAPESSIPR